MNLAKTIKKITLLSLMGLSISGITSTVHADTLQLKDNFPDRYIVVKGDTLWDIAGRFLENPWEWEKIWKNNTDVIENPHWIFPGEALYLHFDSDGNPYISTDATTQYYDIQPVSDSNNSGLPIVQLKPQVRTSANQKAIPTVPLKAIQQFLNRSYVLTNEELKSAPYIFHQKNNRIMSAINDITYARINNNNVVIGKEFDIIRRTNEYKSLKTKASLGFEAHYIGKAVVDKIKGDVAAMRIVEANKEIIDGDLLLPVYPPITNASFIPTAATESANIIDNLSSLTSAAIFDTIVIDKGQDQNIQAGQVFSIFNAKNAAALDTIATINENVQLPEYRKGLAIVFRTFKNVSYALIVESSETVENHDKLIPPQ